MNTRTGGFMEKLAENLFGTPTRLGRFGGSVATVVKIATTVAKGLTLGALSGAGVIASVVVSVHLIRTL